MDEISKKLFSGTVLGRMEGPEESITAVAANVLGREYDLNQLCHLLGAISNSFTTFSAKPRTQTLRVSVEWEEQHSKGRFCYALSRAPADSIFRDTCVNLDLIEVDPTGMGYGTRIVLRLANCLHIHGVQQMMGYAAGGPSATQNGYYTWPRMGFKMNLNRDARQQLSRANLPIETDISDLRRLKPRNTLELFLKHGSAGRRWWREFGHAGRITLELDPSLAEYQYLLAYAAEQGIDLS